MCGVWVLPLLLLLPLDATAGSVHPERWYQDRWCAKHDGKSEYRLPDNSRVDCLTKTHAVEVDFAQKFYQAIGQALFYSSRTNKLPGIMLILEDSTDRRYLKRLRETIAIHNLDITVWPYRAFR